MHPLVKKTAKFAIAQLERFFDLFPIQKTIVFESNPDFACNSYPAFVQLKQDLPEYKTVWCVSKEAKKPEGVDDIFEYESRNVWQRLKGMYYLHTAKAIVFSNRSLRKYRPEQIALFLCHGSKTKKTRGIYEVDAGVDYINVQSHFFDDIITYEYNCEKSKLVYLGYPRCDWFFGPADYAEEAKQKLELQPDSRYFVWLPTFRKHKTNVPAYQMDTKQHDRMGMPLIASPEELRKLEQFLAERNLYLIYKPHPAEDISGLKSVTLERVRILNDRILAEKNLQLNQLLAGSAGLITDYSSVFFDYLLTDRPIVTTVDDIEEWKKMTGFAFDLDAFLDKATTRAGSLEELLSALKNAAEGRDDKAAGRAEIRELTNIHFDGNSARRVSAFICEKIGE